MYYDSAQQTLLVLDCYSITLAAEEKMQSTPEIMNSIVLAILFFITEVIYNRTWHFGTQSQAVRILV